MSYQCPNCASINADDATFCTNCGTPFNAGQMPSTGGIQVEQKICVNCHRPINVTFSTCPFCGVVQPAPMNTAYVGAPVYSGTHNKVTAGLLGILLGTFGVHKFYLGQTGSGIVYILFCWTGIPSIIGFIEGIVYLTMSDQDFANKYH
jgi:RNA polymerase subunit RPABC4/transcription elongation factor Spt4